MKDNKWSTIILSSAVAFAIVYTFTWLVPIWGLRQIPDKNYHAPVPTAQEVERQKQLQGCLTNGGKPEAWSDGTFKKCN